MLILLTLGLAAWLCGNTASCSFLLGASGGAIIAVGAVAFRLYTLAPVPSTAEQAGYLSAVRGRSARVGPTLRLS